MATLTPTAISRAGVVQTMASASVGGDALANNVGTQYLIYTNGSGSSITVTMAFASTATVDGQSATNRTVAIGAGVTKLIGPFPPTDYNDPATGNVLLTYSGVTSLTVAAFTLTPETN